MATHSSTLAWRIPWTEEPGRLQSMGSQRVGHNWVTSLSFSFIHTHTHILLTLLFSNSVMSNSLWPHGLQHTRLPCPSPSTRVCSSSCSLHWIIPSSHLILWCPLLLLSTLPSFPMSHLFTSDDQNTGASASASVLLVNIQGWSILRLAGLISLLFKELSGVFSSTTFRRYKIFGVLPSSRSRSHNHTWPLGRP